MARDVESLVLQMSADLRRFDKSMAAMRATADRRLNEVEKRALQADRKLSRTMGDAGRNMVASLKSNLSGLAPVLAGAFSTAAVLRYADAYTALQNRLKAAGLEGAALKRVEDSLYESANRNGVAVEATAELYQRAAMARQNLGASEEQLLALVSGTSAALKLQGTSATEASGALLQLGQILGGEKVQAQEYNSLIDQLPVLLQAAADGSDKFGGQISVLTQQVKAGKVTTQEFFAALLKGLAEVEGKAANATPTVGAAFQTLNNQIGRYVGQADQGLSATQRMAQGIQALANNLDTIVPIIGVLATLIGTRYFLALTANSGALIANGLATARLAAFQTAMTASMTGTTTATVVATGAMARLNAMMAANPVGFLLVSFATLAGAIVLIGRVTDGAVPPTESLVRSNEALKRATDAYTEAAEAAAVATGAEAKAAREAASQKRELAAAARDAARAKLAEARATIALVGIEARRKIEAETFNFRGDRAGTTNPISPADRERVRQARADEAAAAKAIADANTAIAAADAAIARSNRGGGGGGGGGSERASRASGPTAEELARQRQLLDLQAEIALLRAQDRNAEADAKQDQLDALNLTKQYEEAGFENAKARAEAQVQALALARQEAQAREEAARQAEGEARALDMMRGFALDMLDVQEQLALTDRDALGVRREILRIRQAERRAALAAAAADTDATEAERNAARTALGSLGGLEEGERRELDSSSEGARDARGIISDLRVYDDAVERAREAYEEIDALRQQDLISEQEAALAKQQIDNDLRAARLANTRTMLDTLATLQNSSNKKIAALGKAAAITQATIDGVLAVQKALASAPPPFNYIQAAIVGAVAAANVAQIAGMADGGLVTGPGGSREDRVLRRLSPGEFVVNAKATAQNRDLLEQINGGRVPGLADGGMVGRVNAATASMPPASSAGSSVTFAPVIDARGADVAAVARLEAVLSEQQRNFAANVKGVVARQQRFKLGGQRK